MKHRKGKQTDDGGWMRVSGSSGSDSFFGSFSKKKGKKSGKSFTSRQKQIGIVISAVFGISFCFYYYGKKISNSSAVHAIVEESNDLELMARGLRASQAAGGGSETDEDNDPFKQGYLRYLNNVHEHKITSNTVGVRGTVEKKQENIATTSTDKADTSAAIHHEEEKKLEEEKPVREAKYTPCGVCGPGRPVLTKPDFYLINSPPSLGYKDGAPCRIVNKDGMAGFISTEDCMMIHSTTAFKDACGCVKR